MFAKLILPGGFFHPAKTIFAGTVFPWKKTVFSTNRQKLANPDKFASFCRCIKRATSEIEQPCE
jgi:hypothetical protein